MKYETENKDNTFYLISAIAIISVIGLWFLTLFLLKDNGTEDRGTFGDMFGSINALFSGLAFAGIIITILLQRKELELQRKELIETRKEFIQQNETLKRQRFESTFFQLLDLHHDIIDNLSSNRSGVKLEKREFLEKALQTLKNYYKDQESKLRRNLFLNEKQKNNSADITKIKINDSEEANLIKEGYRLFYLEYNNYLSHYFRNLYHIFKYLYLSSSIKETEKQFYSNVVRAQLSNSELLLIFYNALIEGSGYPKFKYLIDHFDILQNLDNNFLLKKYHKEIFNKMKPAQPFEEELKASSYI